MELETVIVIVILSIMFITGVVLWWTRPDGLEMARQRERALKAMERWTM